MKNQNMLIAVLVLCIGICIGVIIQRSIKDTFIISGSMDGYLPPDLNPGQDQDRPHRSHHRWWDGNTQSLTSTYHAQDYSPPTYPAQDHSPPPAQDHSPPDCDNYNTQEELNQHNLEVKQQCYNINPATQNKCNMSGCGFYSAQAYQDDVSNLNAGGTNFSCTDSTTSQPCTYSDHREIGNGICVKRGGYHYWDQNENKANPIPPACVPHSRTRRQP